MGNPHGFAAEEPKTWQEQDWLCFIQQSMDHVLAPLSEHPVPFYVFLRTLCEPVTSHLAHLAQCHGGPFIAGILTLRSLEGQQIELNIFLYFKTDDGTWRISKLQTQAQRSQISDWITEPRLMPLRLGDTLEYPIEPPAQP